MIWKRVRPRRDEKEFEKARKEIAELKRQQENGEGYLYYFDETGFDLQRRFPMYGSRKKYLPAGVPASAFSDFSARRTPDFYVLFFMGP